MARIRLPRDWRRMSLDALADVVDGDRYFAELLLSPETTGTVLYGPSAEANYRDTDEMRHLLLDAGASLSSGAAMSQSARGRAS